MKRLFLILFLFIMAAANLSAAPSLAIEFIGSQGQRLTVNATYPLPVNAAVSMPVGTATSSPLIVDEYGNTTASTVMILLTGTPVAIASLSNRRDIAMVATGQWQCYIGTTTQPVASATPIYNISFSCAPETPILVGTNASHTTLTIYQQGRP